MNESEFISSIDAKFPYQNEEEAKRITNLGTSISPNAAFMVLHEIWIPPSSANAPPEWLISMANYWLQVVHHSLATVIHKITVDRIRGKRLQIAQAAVLFDEVAKFPHQYNALNIVYFSCGEFDDFSEQKYITIVQGWQSA